MSLINITESLISAQATKIVLLIKIRLLNNKEPFMNNIVLSENQSAECPHCGKSTSCTIFDDITTCDSCGKAVECTLERNGKISLKPAPEAWPGSRTSCQDCDCIDCD